MTAEDRTFSASVSFCDGDDNGGGDGGVTVPLVSGDTNNDEGDRTSPGGADAGTKVLPATGGVTLVAAVDALLLAGGLIARRITR